MRRVWLRRFLFFDQEVATVRVPHKGRRVTDELLGLRIRREQLQLAILRIKVGLFALTAFVAITHVLATVWAPPRVEPALSITIVQRGTDVSVLIESDGCVVWTP